ncbi:MAG: response regulator [Chloroflexi bacterium]|nr:response regulator [Chloroflexota bacterium]
MTGPEGPASNEAALRDRLSRLSQASLRINESLEFESVLQGVLDSACDLTDAKFGAITMLGDGRQPDGYVVAGLSSDQARALWDFTEGFEVYEYLGRTREPLRFADFQGHIRARGLPEVPLSAPVGPFLLAPIIHVGELVGTIYLSREQGEPEFSSADEEILVMFASQAALVIANARRYREERRSRLDLETLIDTSPVGVIVFDAADGGVVSANREARRIAAEIHPPGGSLEEALKTVTVRRADGEELSLADHQLSHAFSGGKSVRAEEISFETPDGSSVSLLVNATPNHSEDGAVDTIIVNIQDLAPLEELERLRAEFLGMVSHELRTPLTSIRGSASTLLDGDLAMDPEEAREFHRIILEQTDHMRGLINDLVDLARIKSGTLSVDAEPIEVIALVNEARNAFRGAGGDNTFAIDLPPDLPRIMADRRRIRQVLTNLIRNAAGYSGDSSTIGLSAEQQDSHVAISVADEGRGIPPEMLSQLFSRYSRLGPDRGSSAEGSGLGLAICKGLVEAHGGRIWAESEGEGRGARFTFTVPAVDEPNLAALAAPSRATARSRQRAPDRRRILAVDDDPHALRYIRDSLQKSGYNPVVTVDPGEVDRLLEESQPDLVLLDLMLPGSDGIDVMRAIQVKADVPVIFLSAYGQQENIIRALDLGAADYIVKPFSTAELAARIRAALRKRSQFELPAHPEPFRLGNLTIDYGERRLTVAGRNVELTAREYAVLFELSVNSGRVMTHEQLLLRVWGSRETGDSSLVRTIVNRLRRKLGDDAKNPSFIITMPGVGYRMARSIDSGVSRTAP